MASEKQDRRIYLDIIKGIAIFLMLWGHSIQYCSLDRFDYFENPVFKFIYSFHMPLFMIVSGYLFSFSCKKRGLRDLLVHKTQGLLQPIIMCTATNCFLINLIPFLHLNFSGILGANWLNQLESIWFLWSVLASSIIVGIAYNVKNLIFRIIILVVGFPFVCLFPNTDLNIFMYPFFVIGFIFAFVKDKIPNWLLKTKYITLVIFPIMLIFYHKRDFIYTSGIINNDYDVLSMIIINSYRWAIGLIGSIFVLVIVEFFVIAVSKAHIFRKIGTLISCLGQKSLQIYCLSLSLLSFYLPKVIKLLNDKTDVLNVFTQNMVLYNYLLTPFIALIYSVGLYYLILLLERLKISKVIFGR